MGFTVLELITVIILLGIMAAVVAPRFFDTRDFDAHQFHSEAVNAARYARQFAVTKGCNTRFLLNSTGFSLARDSNCDSSDGNDFSTAISAPDDPSQAYAQNGAPLGTASGTIIFDATGNADSTQTLVVGSTSITVDASTGFVR